MGGPIGPPPTARDAGQAAVARNNDSARRGTSRCLALLEQVAANGARRRTGRCRAAGHAFARRRSNRLSPAARDAGQAAVAQGNAQGDAGQAAVWHCSNKRRAKVPSPLRLKRGTSRRFKLGRRTPPQKNQNKLDVHARAASICLKMSTTPRSEATSESRGAGAGSCEAREPCYRAEGPS